jgi:hypothetical protein
MDVNGIGWAEMDWIDLAENRDELRCLVNTSSYFVKIGKFLSSCAVCGLSKRFSSMKLRR